MISNEWRYTEWFKGYRAFSEGVDIFNNPYPNDRIIENNRFHSKYDQDRKSVV